MRSAMLWFFFSCSLFGCGSPSREEGSNSEPSPTSACGENIALPSLLNDQGSRELSEPIDIRITATELCAGGQRIELTNRLPPAEALRGGSNGFFLLRSTELFSALGERITIGVANNASSETLSKVIYSIFQTRSAPPYTFSLVGTFGGRTRTVDMSIPVPGNSIGSLRAAPGNEQPTEYLDLVTTPSALMVSSVNGHLLPPCREPASLLSRERRSIDISSTHQLIETVRLCVTNLNAQHPLRHLTVISAGSSPEYLVNIAAMSQSMNIPLFYTAGAR